MITDLTIIGNKITINSNKDDILTTGDESQPKFPTGVKLTVHSIKINNGIFDLDYTVVDTRLRYNTMYNIYDSNNDKIMKTDTSTACTGKNVLTMTTHTTSVRKNYGEYIYEFVKEDDINSTDIILDSNSVKIKQICINSDGTTIVKFLSKCNSGSTQYGFTNVCQTTSVTTSVTTGDKFTINIQNVNEFSLNTESKYMNILDNNIVYNSINQYFFKTYISLERNWSCITSNAGGDILAATVHGGNIWISKDSGNTWTEHDKATSAIAKNQNWASITSNATGVILAAVVSGGRIWMSNDSGDTWTAKTSTDQGWNSITSNTGGNILAAAVNGGNIWISKDSGNTWTEHDKVTSTITKNQNWVSITSNATGVILAAVVSGGRIWMSTNSGDTWTAKTSTDQGWHSITSTGTTFVATIYADKRLYDGNGTALTGVLGGAGLPLGVASNGDGTKLVCMNGEGGNIIISNNSGTNWNNTGSSPAKFWTGITTNSSFSKLAAVVKNGGIWTYDNTHTSWIEHINTN